MYRVGVVTKTLTLFAAAQISIVLLLLSRLLGWHASVGGFLASSLFCFCSLLVFLTICRNQGTANRIVSLSLKYRCFQLLEASYLIVAFFST